MTSQFRITRSLILLASLLLSVGTAHAHEETCWREQTDSLEQCIAFATQLVRELELIKNFTFKKNQAVGEVQSMHFATPLPCGENKDGSCGHTDRWCPGRVGQASWVSEKVELWCHGLKEFCRPRSAIMWIRFDHDLGFGFMGDGSAYGATRITCPSPVNENRDEVPIHRE